MSRLIRSQRRRASLSRAIPEDVLTRSLHDLISVLASVPEADRGQWYRSMEKFISGPQSGQVYDLHEPGRLWLRLARATWAAYPEQNLNMVPGEVCGGTSARRGGPSSVAPGRGGSDDY